MAAGQLGGQLYPTHGVKDKKREAKINHSFGHAIQAWNRHEYKKAVELFHGHVRDYPDSPWASEAVLHLGCDARYHGRYREAEEHYRWIIEKNKGSGHEGAKMLLNKARQRLGVLKVLQNNLKEAKEQFRLLKQESPDWRQRTYAAHWIQRLSRYKSNELAMLNCGAQALASILRRDGRESEAREVLEILPPSTRGHSIKALADMASEYGYDLEGLSLSVSELREVPLPAIVQISGRGKGDRGHYWVLEQAGGEMLVLHDPQSGRRFQQSFGEFSREWDGRALVFSGEEELPGVRLAEMEMEETYGGCCGAPAPEDDLGCGGSSAGGGGSSQGAPTWRVNMLNMNLYVKDTPMWYRPSIGPSVEVSLSYNSQSAIAYHEPFGNKWQFNYGSYLVVDTSGAAIVFMPDGRRDEYVLNGAVYEPPYQVFNELVRVADDRYEVRLRDGTAYVYSMPKVIVQITANGSAIIPPTEIIQYFLVEKRDAYGQKLNFTYDADGQLVTITDAVGRLMTLSYNPDGRVVQAADPFGRTASFDYDAGGNLTKITDMGGYWSSFTYDADVYLTSIENLRGKWDFSIEPADGIPANSDNYPPPGDDMWENYRITVTNPLGGKEEFFYYAGCDDDFDLCSGYSWHVSPRDYVEWKSQEINNYRSKAPKTRYFPTLVGTAGTFAEIGKILTPEERVTTFSYDGAGNRTGTVDAHGHAMNWTYNAKGMVTSFADAKGTATNLMYAPNDVDLLEIQDVLGNASLTYNSAHDVTSITDRLGNSVSFSYNGFGQLTSFTDRLGIVTSYGYDANRLVTQATRDGRVLLRRTYDPFERIRTETDATGLARTYDYNDINSITRVSYPDGNFLSFAYSTCCPNLLEGVTDRAGREMRALYDDLKRLTQVKNAEGGVVTFVYDANGNGVKLIDENGNETSFAYDLDDRLIRRTFADETFVTLTYDTTGLVTSRRNARGTNVVYSYDENHNLVDVTYSDGTPGVSSQYDLTNRMTQRQDAVGTYAYEYDAESRLLSIDGPWVDDTAAFQYDASGRVTGMNVQGGQSVTYVYDTLNRLQSVQSGSSSFSYAYTGASPLIQSLTRPNGSVSTYEYDILNRLTEISNRDSTAQVINQYAYAYNSQDVRSSETVTSGSPISSFQNDLTTYDYDNVNQLLSFSSPAKTVLHDDDGNMTQGYTPDGYVFTAAYDAENRLTSLAYTDGSGTNQRTDYHYSGDDFLARMLKYEDSVVQSEQRFVRTPFLPAQERDASNAVTREYLWGLSKGGGIGGLLSVRQAGQDYAYLYDGKGNVMGLVDGTESPVVTYRYSPFGVLLQKAGTLDQEFRFSTKRCDEGTGLSYYGYRFYAPVLGRWMTRDPLLERGGINLYRFVMNNPVNMHDAFGLAPSAAVSAAGSVPMSSSTTVSVSGGFGVGGTLSVSFGEGGFDVGAGIGVGIGVGASITGGVTAGSSNLGLTASVSGGTGVVGAEASATHSLGGISGSAGVGLGVGLGASITFGRSDLFHFGPGDYYDAFLRGDCP
jgi:RHS repeat-associated protein